MPAEDHLLDVAAQWSYWTAPPPPSVPRTVALPTELRPGIALAIQGVRRSGKSTLMTQLIARYGLDRTRCLFLNLEDPRLAGALDHTTLQKLVHAYEAAQGPATYFLDEIQHVDGWQKWLRTQLDRPRGRRFVITGSNSSLLAGELGSALTGRHLLVELFPFDFAEFRAARPDASLADYLAAGGFPGTLHTPDADLLLRGYFNDIVERDVRERVAARSTLPLRQLAQMLFESAGSELSVRRAAAAIGMTDDTTALYLQAIESAYLAFACPFFAWSARKRAARQKKYYPVDTGLRRVAVTRTGADRGKQLECATFLALRRRFREVFYWRDRGEVDFVVLHEGKPLPVQVSWEGTQERHQQALRTFYEQHREAHEAVFVSADSFAAGLGDLPEAARS